VRNIDFPWPPTDGRTTPQWTGNGFLVDGKTASVLTYAVGDSGWSDGLTQMHESCAGTDHPIDQMSRQWASSALRRYTPSRNPVVLEVGCSSGLLIEALSAEWSESLVMGSDFVLGPLERLATRLPGLPLLQFDVTRCPLPDASIDAIIMLNVLEHIENDAKAVEQAVRILRPGGIMIVEVPAGPHLYDAYDEYLQHHRRYTAGTLSTLLAGAGLDVLEQSHLGFIVYPAFAAAKRKNQKQGATSPEAKRRIVQANIVSTRSSSLLRLVLTTESWLGRFVSFPFGIRTVAVAKKRGGRTSPGTTR